MSTLSWYGMGVGAALLAIGVTGLIRPPVLQRALEAFPRHRLSAIVLTVINVVWVTWLLIETPLGRFEGWKPALYLLSPATLLAVILYMDELLAPRMWGGFLLLLAVPVLDAARWHESGLRLVLTVVVYGWVVWAMLLMLSPYRFRHSVEWCWPQHRRPVILTACAVVGASLLVLGVTVY